MIFENIYELVLIQDLALSFDQLKFFIVPILAFTYAQQVYLPF
jgi:hypothetical protein